MPKPTPDEASFIVTREPSGRRHLHVTYPDGTGEVFAFDRKAAARLARDLVGDEPPADPNCRVTDAGLAALKEEEAESA